MREMMANPMRGILIALAVLVSVPALGAEGETKKPKNYDWSFEGPFGTFDRAAMQRGFQVYREVCSACHALDHLHFRTLGQEGGPFYDPDYPNPNDNPVIKALAAEYQVEDGPDDFGEMFMREGRPSDRFPQPFANEQQARAANGGAYPPDLSLIVNARGGGADYIASLMAGYEDPPADAEGRVGLYYNPYFPGEWIAMPPQLFDGRVSYDDGTEATVEQMSKDVTAFLAWASEPKMELRKRMGFGVLAFLLILSVLTYMAYKQVWRDVDH